MAPSAVETETFPATKPALHADAPDILEQPLHELPKLYGWPAKNARGYEIKEQLFGTERDFRVIHIGGGASGICFSKFAEESLKNVSIQIYEKNADVGGTWLENRQDNLIPFFFALLSYTLTLLWNRYPGCACDIPSANYQFTWQRNPNWSKFYSGAPEIWKYFKDVTDSNNLNKYIKLNHRVTGAYWNEDEGLWHVKIQPDDGEEFEDTCNVLINGGGVLK
jgi:cation diffusion facilitator CzcD-associated flavoprotein CzcO